MKKTLVLLFAVIPVLLFGQEEKKFKVKFGGYVKTDIFYDSRQTISAREGQFLLYPANEVLDPNGEDIFAKSNFNMLNIQTRLSVSATGPDVWGAKTSALVEGAFFGSINPDINEFRLRHAFVKLAWPKTQLLIGQYWHPMFHVKCFPGTVSFNTGVPFQPFSRNPQVRVTQALGKFNLAATVLTQRDFGSFGPVGTSTIYLRNSALPIFNLRFEYYTVNKDKATEFLIGLSGNYKILLPTLVTVNGYKSTSTVGSWSFSAYTKYQSKHFAIKLNGFYGQDAFDLLMLGGYAIEDYTDLVTGEVSYSPISTSAIWLEAYYKKNNWQIGIFTAYSKNMGSDSKLTTFSTEEKSNSSYTGQVFYSRGQNIDYLYRIAPRLILNYGKFRVAPEIEYTVAAYATRDGNDDLNRDDYGKITDSKGIGNLRIIVGVYYFF